MRIRKIAVSRVRYAITYLCSAPPQGLAGEHKSMHRLQGKGLTCAIPRGIMVGLPQHSNGCWTRILFLIRCLMVGVAGIHCVGYFYAGKPGYRGGKSLSGEDAVANLPCMSFLRRDSMKIRCDNVLRDKLTLRVLSKWALSITCRSRSPSL